LPFTALDFTTSLNQKKEVTQIDLSRGDPGDEKIAAVSS
jgi:hypothetical protein